MRNWQSFLWTADEWIVNYASAPGNLVSVVTFSIGHAVELYLKAAYTKKTGDITAAISKSHQLKSLWDECKSFDSNFMPSYEIRDSVLGKDPFKQGLDKRLSKDDFEHFGKNMELYLVFYMLPDLKYLGISKKLYAAFAYIHPNDYWIKFFKELRSYLGHPSEKRIDFVKLKLDEGDLSERAQRYLQELYE